MRVAVMSDLHFEWHHDNGKSFISRLSTDIDVLVLAGDINNGIGLDISFKLLRQRYGKTPIVYVPPA
jgi:predicted phosphodiesterase